MGKPILLLAITLLLSGCLNDRAYRVLSFFFDGVPVPGSSDAAAQPAQQAAADGTGQAPDDSAIAAAPAAATPVVYSHSPWAKGSCGSCHDVTSSNAPLKEGNDLCFTCHTTILTGKEVVHVAALADCRSCHNPHTSENAKLLLKEVPDLCFDCHAQEALVEVHGEIGNCMECHNPHESDNAALLEFE